MKILYEKLLTEDIEAVKRQYSYIPEEEFDEIIKLDPTYKEGSNSVGKYGKWLLGLYKKDYPLDHPLYSIEDIYNILDLYNQYKNDRKKEIEKDINKFKSIEDLADALKNAGEAELSDRQKEKELRNAYKDAKLLFSDDKWQVWTPKTYAASCTLGKGTEWCTADSRTDDYYNQYTNEGDLYVFINKQNPKEKYQLHMESKSFMDKDDYKANLEDVLATDDKLREFVGTEIYGYIKDNSGAYIYNGKNRVPSDAIKIIITDSMKYIHDGEFAFFDSLESIVIPNSIVGIWSDAFYGCESLKSITIPDSVKEIHSGAFFNCESLKSITIPDSVESMGSDIFFDCTSIESVILSNSIKFIESNTFARCESLKSIDIPDSVTKIGHGAFSYCTSLQSVIIPDSVTYIGFNAFSSCDNLKKVILENPNTEYEKNTFPKHTKIIKKGVNENMKIKTNESINLKRAKKLLESNGYIVRKKKYLKESDDDTWSNILQSISKTVDNIDNVTMNAQSNINDILHGKHTAIPNVVLSDSETSFLLNIYDKLLLLQDEISQIDDYIWRR